MMSKTSRNRTLTTDNRPGEIVKNRRSKNTMYFLTILILTAFGGLLPSPTLAANISVDGINCTLSDAITAANNDTVSGGCSAGSGADTITLTADFTLNATLPLIASDITFEGGNHFVSGADTYRIFWVTSGTVTFKNMTIKNGKGQGGNGGSCGGGAAGLGGGLFVQTGTVVVDTVTFSSNNATGGNGGSLFTGSGGGGGGGGLRDTGGSGVGVDWGGGGGGIGGIGDGGQGGTNAGNKSGGSSGGWGGGGGGSGGDVNFYGGTGGWGGGGGGGGCNNGWYGIGGGGGGAGGRGSGTCGNGGQGGGGLGAGGAIFARAGTTTLINVTFTSNSTTAGTGASNGTAKGKDVFICTSSEDSSCGAVVNQCGSTSATAVVTGEGGAFTLCSDTTPPTAPTVSGATPTNDTTPTWSWTTGGGGGNGTFRYKLDSSDLTSGATEITAASFTSASALSEGSYTLYVQERDEFGNWSTSGSKTIVIDITPPTAPSTPDMDAASDSGSSNSDNSTNDPTPTFSGTAEAGSTV